MGMKQSYENNQETQETQVRHMCIGCGTIYEVQQEREAYS
jgi:hypothetical protein